MTFSAEQLQAIYNETVCRVDQDLTYHNRVNTDDYITEFEFNLNQILKHIRDYGFFYNFDPNNVADIIEVYVSEPSGKVIVRDRTCREAPNLNPAFYNADGSMKTHAEYMRDKKRA